MVSTENFVYAITSQRSIKLDHFVLDSEQVCSFGEVHHTGAKEIF